MTTETHCPTCGYPTDGPGICGACSHAHTPDEVFGDDGWRLICRDCYEDLGPVVAER